MADAYIAIELSESSVNITNNTSVVTATLVYYGNGVSWSDYQCPWSITLDGTSYSGNYSGISTSTSRQVIATRSKTVTHNANGTKTVSASASLMVTGTSLGTLSTSASKTLQTIPRASSVKLSSGGTVGSSASFAITRYSSSFTHRAQWRVKGGRTWSTIGSGYGTSFSWTPPMSILNSFPNTASPQIEILLTTYNGTASIGTYTTTITLTAGASVVPTFTSAAASLVKNKTYQGTAYIQGNSGVQVTFTGAEGAYSSTIKTYRVTTGGAAYTSASAVVSVPVISQSGTVSLKCEVIDSRGRVSASQTPTISVEAYSLPAISGFTPYRSNAQGAVMSDGEYVAAVVVYDASVLTDNPITWELQYRLEGSTEWTTYKTGQATSADATIVSDTAIASVDYSYDLRLVVSDPFNQATAEGQVFSEQVLVDYHYSGTGVAFGKVADRPNAVESAFSSFRIREVEYAFTDEFVAKWQAIVGANNLQSILEKFDVVDIISAAQNVANNNSASGDLETARITIPQNSGAYIVAAFLDFSASKPDVTQVLGISNSNMITVWYGNSARGNGSGGGGIYNIGVFRAREDADGSLSARSYSVAGAGTFNHRGRIMALRVGS